MPQNYPHETIYTKVSEDSAKDHKGVRFLVDADLAVLPEGAESLEQAIRFSELKTDDRFSIVYEEPGD